jgi:multidrug efflux pump subunit AcrB
VRLPKLAITHHRFTEAMVALMAVLGLLSFLTMPRSEDPMFDVPFINVVVVFPGADPEVVEVLAVDPLEEAIREIESMRTLRVSIEDGVALFTVEMIPGTNSDEALGDVLQKVNEVMPNLPEELRSVEVVRQSLADVAVMQIALIPTDGDLSLVPPLAEELQRRIERAPGVMRADTWGYEEREVRVSLDAERMRALGISVDQVAGAIQAAGANIPGGFVTSGDRRLNVRTSGDFGSLNDIARALIPGIPGRILRVADVADVAWGTEDESHRTRFDGEPAVFITVIQRENANILAITDAVYPIVEAFRGDLPEGVRLEIAFDQSPSVVTRVNGFFSSLVQGILLVGVVMFLFVGARPALLVMISIPLAILLALAGVDMSGFGLQQMSIVGLVIALGLLVDDAIVVVESVGRLRRLGRTRLEAALEGTSEVGWPSVTGTVTTVLAFLPMVVIQSATGDYVRSLPVTVIYALLASLLISLTFIPLMAIRILSPHDAGGAEPPFTKHNGWLQPRIEAFARGPYRRILGWSLVHPLRVCAAATVALVGAVALVPFVGVSLFPKAEKAQFLVNVEAPEGTTLDATDAIVRWVESVVGARPEVIRQVANSGSDNPQVYYNVEPRQSRSNIGQVLVELDRYGSAATVVPALQSEFDRYPGARVTVIEFENGPPVEAPIVFRVTGRDLSALKELAGSVEEVVRTTSGTRDVRNPLGDRKTDLRVAIDRDRLALFSLDPLTVDRTIRASLAGLEVGRFRDAANEEAKIVVRFPFQGQAPSVDDLDRITLTNALGVSVPLAQVASLEFVPGTGRIDHYDDERVATVTAFAEAGYSVLGLTREVSTVLETMEWPAGYRWFTGGTFEEQQEGFAGMIRALLIAVLGIFAVLVLQFRSLLQPVIIFASIPLAFIGAVLALLVTGYTFSFTAFIGVTSLVGIVINNSIILVDRANEQLARGGTADEAVLRAGETRFQPIVLTTMTTVGGLIPLALTRSEMWSPLALAIIGGLLTSTVLTLVLVPVLYRMAADLIPLTRLSPP